MFKRVTAYHLVLVAILGNTLILRSHFCVTFAIDNVLIVPLIALSHRICVTGPLVLNEDSNLENVYSYWLVPLQK